MATAEERRKAEYAARIGIARTTKYGTPEQVEKARREHQRIKGEQLIERGTEILKSIGVTTTAKRKDRV